MRGLRLPALLLCLALAGNMTAAFATGRGQVAGGSGPARDDATMPWLLRAALDTRVDAQRARLVAQGRLPLRSGAALPLANLAFPLRLRAGFDHPGFHGTGAFVDLDAPCAARYEPRRMRRRRSAELPRCVRPRRARLPRRVFPDQRAEQVVQLRVRRPDGSVFDAWSFSHAEVADAPERYPSSFWYWWWDFPPDVPVGTWRWEVEFEGTALSHPFAYGAGLFGDGFETR